jgi:hypothetical protein
VFVVQKSAAERRDRQNAQLLAEKERRAKDLEAKIADMQREQEQLTADMEKAKQAAADALVDEAAAKTADEKAKALRNSEMAAARQKELEARQKRIQLEQQVNAKCRASDDPLCDMKERERLGIR